LEKILKYHISGKSVQWEPSCFMRTDRHDEANTRFSQFCEKRLKICTAVTILQRKSKREANFDTNRWKWEQYENERRENFTVLKVLWQL